MQAPALSERQRALEKAPIRYGAQVAGRAALGVAASKAARLLFG